MAADHLFPILDNEDVSELLARAASIMAQGMIPDDALTRVRLGRLTALQKTRRWRQGDRGGRHHETSSGEDHGEARGEEGRESHSSLSSTP